TTSTTIPPTPEWLKIDSIVLSWKFMTLSETLQAQLVVEDPQTAKEAWDLIPTIFKDNKMSRFIALKAELRSLKLGDLSINDYFRKIKSIATILTSLGSSISNDDVVTIALEWLNDKYDNVAGIIVHMEPFLDLKTVCLMLTTEEMRLKSKSQGQHIDSFSSSPIIILAEQGNNTRRATLRHVKFSKLCFNFAKCSCRFGNNFKFVHDGCMHAKPNNPSLWSVSPSSSSHLPPVSQNQIS
ncbi:hybrid signal transduction histidine kinase M, partial [Tanacetum coccineum]